MDTRTASQTQPRATGEKFASTQTGLVHVSHREHVVGHEDGSGGGGTPHLAVGAGISSLVFSSGLKELDFPINEEAC